VKSELIIALDVPTADQIPAIVNSLPEAVHWYKVGLELFVAEGPSALQYLKEHDKRIFLDLKLHDIPRTVAHAVKTAARHQIDLLTVHASGGHDMLEAAAEAALSFGPDRPRLVAVTALTSLGQVDIQEMGVTMGIGDYIQTLGELARKSGIDGLVCSVHEATRFRETLGADPILVTPGIRPAGTAQGDQKRVATPAMAIRAGADYLVVGRPIVKADNPHQAALDILSEMGTSTPT
jgi:orotidine-5'-phosphate decarboxylase